MRPIHRPLFPSTCNLQPTPMAVSILVPISMFGWIPLVLKLFQRLRPHHAVIAGFLLAWMFLPQYDYKMPVIPNYSKISAASYGILLGTYLFNRQAFRNFKFHIYDLPVFFWCLAGFISSVTNGLGVWDGMSAMLGKVTQWGIPYFIGRLYFDRLSHLRDLALGIFLGALVYIPFCIYEIIMSPRLHKIVYGWHPHHFGQTKRGGGWRPQVFMEHGLMNAMWMASGTLAGLRLYFTKQLGKRLPVIPIPSLVAVIAVTITFFLCKSMGATLLMLAGLGAIIVTTRTKRSLLLFVLMLYPSFYMITRGTGMWDAENLLNVIRAQTSEERSGSLEFRIQNENILSEKARERLIFGWAGWKRAWVYNDAGETISIPDGLWIIALGQNGVFGLANLTLAILLPQLLFLRMYPPKRWSEPGVAAVCALPVLLAIFMVDNLLNNMYNPVLLVVAGGLNGLAIRGDIDHDAEDGRPATTPPNAAATPRLL